MKSKGGRHAQIFNPIGNLQYELASAASHENLSKSGFLAALRRLCDTFGQLLCGPGAALGRSLAGFGHSWAILERRSWAALGQLLGGFGMLPAKSCPL